MQQSVRKTVTEAKTLLVFEYVTGDRYFWKSNPREVSLGDFCPSVCFQTGI